MKALDPGWRARFDHARWFLEPCEEVGSLFGLECLEVLLDEHTPWQHLQVLETRHFGRAMVLDGFLMLTQRDNFIYHEMLVHPALCSHRQPRRVLIVGGGDCGCLREVLRHDTVERVVQVELDERVTRAAERFFPELCEANDDPRAEFVFADGIACVADAAAGTFDVIIVDSTDPIGQAARLFDRTFYRQCHRVLGDAGLLAVQSESPMIHLEVLAGIRGELAAAGFPSLATLQFPQPTYPSGWWSVTLAGGDVLEAEPRPAAGQLDTRFYSGEVHTASRVLPSFVGKALGYSAGSD
ncbi:MAG: polyamine aminopropyltransferase [Gammaproteobacteria bacterium]|nr:MAG: polyamine aminopropyltransferase [Gammaproteobacteria bacterium]